MSQQIVITKASGEKESFSRQKLENSLKRAGADLETVRQISADISDWLHEGVSTKKIYRQAFRLLKKYESIATVRYKLKVGIMELGPTGYPFEHFVGQLIKHYGFDIQVGISVPGQCLLHEVDVVATGFGREVFVECKFFNSQEKRANVRVPLYIHSRFNDIVKKKELLPETGNLKFQGWIVTNTRFTSDAIDYGKHAGLHLVSWDYPTGHSLRDMIEKEGFFPITTLTAINKKQKQLLVREGIVLCRQICEDHSVLNLLDISRRQRDKLLKEVKGVCGCQACKS